MERPDRFCEPMWGAKQRRRAIFLPWIVWALVVGAAIGLVVYASQARAAFDCHDFAMIAGSAADFRDAGADMGRTVKIARARNIDRTQAELALIEREVRRVFRERKTRRLEISQVYRRCRASRGSMD